MDWRLIPSLHALRAFEATSRLLSFSKAAVELNVTHAAISQHVRALEAEFGESLVFRQGRGLALTEQGAQFASTLRTGFVEIENAVHDLRRHGDARPLNISATPAFAGQWLMPRIGDFWQKHPDVVLNINPSIHLVDLAQDGYDMAIRYGAGDWPGLSAKKLLDGDFMVVAHPDLLAGRDTTCLDDVRDIPWLLEGSMMERTALLQSSGVDFDEADVRIFTTNELVLSAVHAGLGMSIQTGALVRNQIADGSLVNVCALKQDQLSYYIVTQKDRHHKDLAVFTKWLLKMAC
jgi:LysR family glycine cleavage system transcriptional activator